MFTFPLEIMPFQNERDAPYNVSQHRKTQTAEADSNHDIPILRIGDEMPTTEDQLNDLLAFGGQF